VSEADIIIDKDGTIRHLIDEPGTDGLGDMTEIYRNSHVDVIRDLPTAAQEWLSDHGVAYDHLAWYADMLPVDGPVLGPFNKRQEALDAEITWLREHHLPPPVRKA
jgi:hypothetical protein